MSSMALRLLFINDVHRGHQAARTFDPRERNILTADVAALGCDDQL